MGIALRTAALIWINGPLISRAVVDRKFRVFGLLIQSEGVVSRRDTTDRGSTASLQPRPLVCSVISNWTALLVFFWITVARLRTRPPAHTSAIWKRTRPQPLSLLSMARLNRAKSRFGPPPAGGRGWSKHPSASSQVFGQSCGPYSKDRASDAVSGGSR